MIIPQFILLKHRYLNMTSVAFCVSLYKASIQLSYLLIYVRKCHCFHGILAGSTRDNSSGQMREMLHEAEAMLDMVEKRKY